MGDETLTLTDATAETLSVAVTVLHADAKPRVFRLTSGTCRIGSAPDNDVVISDARVSRNHVELTLTPLGVVVQDVGSRNGTFYLEQRIERAVLDVGSTIRLGSVDVALSGDQDAYAQVEPYAGETFRGMVGRSIAMRRIFAMLERLDASLAPVLVEGESGTGKELVAHAIHEGSSVRGQSFVAVNCGALPRDLVASELFGHKKGAFTGATESRQGAFDAANGGTLFLDEIGELPRDVQPMLLRALESGEVRAVGSDTPHIVKVRVVAATNRDLETEVSGGTFREDLFFRLAVVRIALPPLRERPEDVTPLARAFAANVGLAELPDPVIEHFKARNWSGNARELRNAVMAYAALGVIADARPKNASALVDAALTGALDARAPFAEQRDKLVERFTAIYLRELLAATGGNQSAAARISGIDRGHLGKLVAKYGLAKK